MTPLEQAHRRFGVKNGHRFYRTEAWSTGGLSNSNGAVIFSGTRVRCIDPLRAQFLAGILPPARARRMFAAKVHIGRQRDEQRSRADGLRSFASVGCVCGSRYEQGKDRESVV